MPLLDFFKTRRQPAPALGVNIDHTISKQSLTDWLYDVKPADAGIGATSSQKTQIEKGHADWAYACVQVLSDRLATLEWDIYRGDDPIETHPAKDLLLKPNHIQTSIEFLHHTYAQLLLCGNAYWYAWYGKGSRQPVELLPLSPSLMTLQIDEINWKIEYIWNGQKLDNDAVLHMRLPNPASMWVGASPIEAACYAHDVSLYSQIYQQNFFKNNARPDFVVILPPNLPANRESAKQVWDVIMDRHSGLDNSHKPLVLGNGSAIQALSVGDADRRYLEASNATRDKVLAIYRVPAAKLGLVADSNRANADAADYTFNRDSVQPRSKIIACCISEYLSRLYRDDLAYRYESPTASDSIEERAQEQHEIEMGLASRNEIRQRHGQEPIEGGDVILLRAGLIPADMAGASQQAAIDMRQALMERPTQPQAPPDKPEASPSPEQEESQDPEVAVKAVHPRVLTYRQLVKAATLSRKIPIDIQAEVWGRHCKAMKPGERTMKAEVATIFANEKEAILRALPMAYESRRKSIDYSKPKPSIDAWLRKAEGTDLLDWREEVTAMSDRFDGIIRENLIKKFDEVLRNLRVTDKPVNVLTPELNSWVDRRLATMPASICEQTRAVTDGIIRRALANGQSVDECAATIQAQFEAMEDWRAAMIARTEMNAVMNIGAVEAYDESGIVEKKQWLAAFDERTRTWDNGDEFNHTIDEIVALNEPFMGTGEALDHPGASEGSPGNVCNCRCTTVPVIEGMED